MVVLRHALHATLPKHCLCGIGSDHAFVAWVRQDMVQLEIVGAWRERLLFGIRPSRAHPRWVVLLSGLTMPRMGFKQWIYNIGEKMNVVKGIIEQGRRGIAVDAGQQLVDNNLCRGHRATSTDALLLFGENG